jgi:hypoxanthine phosphoribosyltransferase
MREPISLRELYSAADVRTRIAELADELYRAFAGRPVLFVAIAEGALRFTHALTERLRERDVDPEVLVLRATRTAGTELIEVELDAPDPTVFRGRDVLILDDIADEGRTLHAVSRLVHSGGPESVRIAVLVSKTERRELALQLDYVGFEVESGWVLGFGMDLDGRYRDLDYLAIAEGSDPE